MKKIVPINCLNKCIICMEYTMENNCCMQCNVCILCNICKEKVEICPCCRKESFKKNNQCKNSVIYLILILIAYISGTIIRFLMDYPYTTVWDIFLNFFLGLPIIFIAFFLAYMLRFLFDG